MVTGYDTKGRPQQLTATFRGGRREAELELANMVSDVTRGKVALNRHMTFGQLLDTWLEHQTKRLGPKTMIDYRSKCEIIKAKLGHVRLDKLTTAMLDRAYGEWLGEQTHRGNTHTIVSRKALTVRHYHARISAALEQAVKWRLLPFNPAEHASPPRAGESPMQVPEAPIVYSLIDQAQRSHNPKNAAVIAVAAGTGCRRGELAALSWADFTINPPLLRIARAVHAYKDGDPMPEGGFQVRPGWVVADTKTHQVRVVRLDPETVDVLSKHRAIVEATAAAAGVAIDDDCFIFSKDLAGRVHITPDSVTQALGRLRRKAGVTGVSPHTLRHFSASSLIDAGIPLTAVVDRHGWKDWKMLLRYSHVMATGAEAAVDAMGRIMAAGRSQEDIPADPHEPAAKRKGAGELISSGGPVEGGR